MLFWSFIFPETYTLFVHIIVTLNYDDVFYFFRFFQGGQKKGNQKRQITVTFDENLSILEIELS